MSLICAYKTNGTSAMTLGLLKLMRELWEQHNAIWFSMCRRCFIAKQMRIGAACHYPQGGTHLFQLLVVANNSFQLWWLPGCEMTLPNASKVGYLCLWDERNGQGWLSIYFAWNDNTATIKAKPSRSNQDCRFLKTSHLNKILDTNLNHPQIISQRLFGITLWEILAEKKQLASSYEILVALLSWFSMGILWLQASHAQNKFYVATNAITYSWMHMFLLCAV